MPESPASWLRISLEVEAELAEAVAEALSRFVSGGIAIESTAIQANPQDEGRPVGPLRVVAYLPVDDKLEDTRQRIEQALRYLALIQPIPEPVYIPIQEANWMEAWKQHYRPLEVGHRLLILPAWMEAPPGDRLAIRIDPGMAFGTGVHPTTQLILQLLEELIQSGDAVIDVGCGSGILSIAAVRLGAGEVLGVDIEAEAIENARHNAELNGVSVQLEQGSLEEIRGGAFAFKQAELVVANIIAPILVRLLAEGLSELVAAGGSMILSGILAEQEAEIGRAMDAAGLRVERRLQMGDWLAFAAVRA
jgi:ribosomal protein L11 methyltransferase